MWNRKMLKENAKASLRKYYWQMFLVALVLMLIGGTSSSGPFGGSGGSSGRDGGNSPGMNYNSFVPDLKPDIGPGVNFVEFRDGQINLPFLSDPSLFMDYILFIAAGATLLIIVFYAVWRIFLGYPLEVGCRKFFVRTADDKPDLNHMKFCFNNETYWNVVKAMFMRSLFNFFWYLALIIPGIIKSYAYSMVPFLLADNPHLNYDEAIGLSQEMTLGHKFNMFVLDLSFIGWYFLGLLLCGIGGIFVNPYYHATRAELYLNLRETAIEKGLCTPDLLNLSSHTETPFL